MLDQDLSDWLQDEITQEQINKLKRRIMLAQQAVRTAAEMEPVERVRFAAGHLRGLVDAVKLLGGNHVDTED